MLHYTNISDAIFFLRQTYFINILSVNFENISHSPHRIYFAHLQIIPSILSIVIVIFLSVSLRRKFSRSDGVLNILIVYGFCA